MTEHQVVVVFDVEAPTLLDAGQRIAEMYRPGSAHRGNLHAYGVQSWWMPEEPLRSQVDGNDNAAMHLEPDDPPQDIYVEDDAEDDEVIWLDTGDPERPLALISHCAFARLVGGDDHALPLWRRLTDGLPTSAPTVTS